MLYAYEEGAALHLLLQTPVDMKEFLNDETGEMLFAFADADLDEPLQRLLGYFRSRVDQDTLEIRPEDEELLQKAINAMIAIHPFFSSSDHSSALPDLLAASYNELLLKNEASLDEEEYRKRINELTRDSVSLLMNRDGYPNRYHDQLLFTQRCYKQYQSGQRSRYSLTSLLSFQKYVRAYLYWVLDVSSDRFHDLNLTERLCLFRQVFGEMNDWQPLRLKEFSFIGNLSNISKKGLWQLLQSATNGGTAEDFNAIVEETQRKKEMEAMKISYASALTDLTSDQTELDADLRRWMKKQIQIIKKETSQPLFKAYEISSFSDYILLQLRLFTEQSAIIKRCKNCGQYFITERTNIDYCQRIPEGETQTCFVIGPRRVYKKVLSEDLPRKLYAKAYKRYQARLRRGTIDEETFEAWKAKAKQYLSDIQNDRISVEEYQAWMES